MRSRGGPKIGLKPETLDFVRRAARALPTLTPREEKVLRLRAGLDGGAPLSLKQIGISFGFLSVERIRSIEAKALRKLRHSSREQWIDAPSPAA